MNAPAFVSKEFRDKTSATGVDLARAHHMPSDCYASEAIAEQEKTKIFMKSWLCVARAEEFPNPGDYQTLRIAGEPIVIARDERDGIVAFMNMCLHRGVEIAFGDGNAGRFRCPYHAWTYDAGGNLLGAPLMKESGHPMDGCRLPRLKTAEWRGWVFLNFDENAVPFDTFIKQFESDLGWYRTGEVKLARKFSMDIPCNWKFVIENLVDWYHARVIHADTFGKFYKIGADQLPVKLLPEGASSLVWDSKSRKLDTNLPFPHLPWLEEGEAFSAKGTMFPNMNFMSATDSLRMWTLWPVSAGECRATVYVMLTDNAFDVDNFEGKLDRYCEYLRAIAAEDRAALISLQAAASSGRFEPGPMAHLEVQIHHLLNHYIDVMSMD